MGSVLAPQRRQILFKGIGGEGRPLPDSLHSGLDTGFFGDHFSLISLCSRFFVRVSAASTYGNGMSRISGSHQGGRLTPGGPPKSYLLEDRIQRTSFLASASSISTAFESIASALALPFQ